jgi:hypothetical protein
MFTLHMGECEHCWRSYRYELWHAGFGEFSYAYCDSCGMLATFDYLNGTVRQLPPLSAPHQEIDAAWEPFLAPCPCGGHFKKDASPRCPSCREPLSAEYAAGHIEHNSVGAARGWHWQRNWNEEYCIAIEEPHRAGTMRRVVDPFLGTAELRKEMELEQELSLSR